MISVRNFDLKQLICRAMLATLLSSMLGGCIAMNSEAINVHTETAGPPSPDFIPDPGDDGSTLVALAFSGGGTRAAAFSYGVLRELDDMVIDEYPYRRTLVDDIRIVSGTSGGAITAAYLGYRGKDDYRDFRERFLIRDGEANLKRSLLSPLNLVRAASGGVNDRDGFAKWLDENVFNGATFAALKTPDTPIVYITASDLYNATPFLFTYDTFAALCSDLDKVNLADAVAASAAVPVAFTPVLIDATKADCGYQKPAWLIRAIEAKVSSLRLKAYARALDSYQTKDKLRFIRLLDGGLTDNFGITGLTLERARATTPHGPLSKEEAIKLRNFVFLVADAGLEHDYSWGVHDHGPNIVQLLSAVTDTTISASVRSGFDAVELALRQWQDELIKYRCSLSLAEVKRYRETLVDWNCRDITIVTEHLSFRSGDPTLLDRLNAVPTRLQLPIEQVDLVIQAGRQAVRRNPAIQKTAAEIRKFAEVPDANAFQLTD